MKKIIIDFPNSSSRKHLDSSADHRSSHRLSLLRRSSSVFSILSKNDTKEEEKDTMDGEKSSARNFLDLTVDDEIPIIRHEINEKRSAKESMSTLSTAFTFDDSTGVGSLYDYNFDNEMGLGDEDGGDDDDNDSTDYDESDTYIIDAWGNADIAFIQQVYAVSRSLEEELNVKGIESPYRKVTEVIPSFKNIHNLVKTELSHQKRENKKKLTVEGDETYGSPYGFRQRQAQRKTLKQFLYEKRGDGSCSLPLVLAHGLEKRLGSYEVASTNETLTELTSPLNNWRPFREVGKRKKNLNKVKSSLPKFQRVNLIV